MTTNLHAMPFGAETGSDGRTRFRLWAPDAEQVAVRIEGSDSRALPMNPLGQGWFELVHEAPGGTRYRYRIGGRALVPDPASRAQPDGPHGPSEVVDPNGYAWRVDWAGRPWREAVLYELHVGTFTARGTFEAATDRLRYLAELGVTALQVMPVATFPGRRNWGYDGVLPFAPAAVYGGPEALRAFVDAAHDHGLMVLLDVVYNHFGPEGNYLNAYASGFFTSRHSTPWGDAIDFDGPDSGPVRDFFVHNALYWLTEFRLDGLRLDAVHAIVDESRPDIVEALATAVQRRFGNARRVHLVLENERNEARYLHPKGGYAAQWNDDFHHAAHTLATGERDGYYVDYADRPAAQLGRCLAEGFAFQGDPSDYCGGAARGEISRDLPLTAFIDFLQNHDQIGNRAFGDRLTTLTSTDALRALTCLLLLAPSVPALFMGDEIGCRAPFLYFADFEEGLADAVRAGRQREFSRFERFGRPEACGLPDPMAESTFRRCVIDWKVQTEPQHAAWHELYRALLATRRDVLVPRLPAAADTSQLRAAGTRLALGWRLADGTRLHLLANLGPASIAADRPAAARGKIVHAEPPDAAAIDTVLPPWSVIWRLAEAQ